MGFKRFFFCWMTAAFALAISGCTTVIDAPQPVEDAVVDAQAAEAGVDEEAVEPEPPRAPRPEDYPAAPFEKETLYQLLVAEVAGYRGHYDMALEKYVEIAESSRDPGVAARATRLAAYLKRNDEALKASQIWAKYDPENLDAHRYAADQLMKSGDLEAAIYHMEAVKNLGGLANFEVFAYRAANLDEQSRQSLLDAISRMLEQYPDDEQLKFSKAVLLEQTGQLEEALVLANDLLATRNNINVIILKVNALKDLHREEDAMAFLETSLEDLPDNRRLRLIYSRFLFEAERLDDARRQYEIVLEESPNDGDILFALALIAMEQDNTVVARNYLNRMVRLDRRAGEAHFYLGTLAEDENDLPEAIREYKQVGNGYEFLPAQARIASLLVEDGRVKEARDYLERARAENPAIRHQLIMVEGQVLSERGLEDDVFDLLDEAVAEDPDNIRLRYFRAMTGEKFGHIDILERDLRHIIEIDPDNADAMNALGYTLTDKTDRHEEALVLIEQALEIKPQEAAFIDSMGWVLYRLEQFEEAVEYLERALEMFQNDEVAAHLGEVLWVMGEKVRAQKIWSEALELAPDSEILNEVIRRFTQP